MKIYPEKLAAELKKGLARVYLISGDEPLLRQQLCDQIRAAARSVGFVERDLFHVETNFDWQALHYSANSLSLFADKKLIEVRLSAAKQPEKAAKALLELASVGEDLVVLLSLPKADASVQKTKWFKALETVGVLVQVWPIESKDLPRWIENRFKDKDFRITRDAVLALSARVEGNLLAAVQEVDRLVLSASATDISLEMVQATVGDHARYDVYQWLDAALAGKAGRCLRILNGLQAEGTEVLMVAGVLTRELRALIGIKEQAQVGSLEAALQGARIWPKRKALISRVVQRLSLDELQALHGAIRAVDAIVKGVEPGEPWGVMANVSMRLSGHRISVPFPK